MNILYVALNEDLGENKAAGFSHTYNICKSLVKLGHNVYLISKKGSLRTEKIDGINMLYEPCSLLDYIFPFLKINRIIKICKKYKIDIVHERHSIPGGLGSISGKILGIKTVLEINSPLAEEVYAKSAIYYIAHMFNKINYIFSNSIITQTDITRSIISKNTNKTVFVIPNGADPSFFKNHNTNYKKLLGIKNKVIMYVGAFTEWHGVEDLVQAVSKIENITLVMIGKKGKSFDACKKLVKDLKIENKVNFVGPIYYAELPKFMSAADVLVAPFNTKKPNIRKHAFEKYGMWWSPVKIFEYMSIGRPIVATKIGAVPEYLGNTGYYYEEGNIKDLENKIKRALNDKNIGKKARKRLIENFTWDAAAKKTENVYNLLLAN